MKYFSILIISISSLNVSCEPYEGELKRVMGPSPDFLWLSEHIEEQEYFKYLSKKLPGWSQVLLRTKDLDNDLDLSGQIVQYALLFESGPTGLDCLEVFIDKLVGTGDLALLNQLDEPITQFFAKNATLVVPTYYGGLITWSRSLSSKSSLGFLGQSNQRERRQILDQKDNIGQSLVQLSRSTRGQLDASFFAIISRYETSAFLTSALAHFSPKVKNPLLLSLFEFKKSLLAQSYKEAYALIVADKKAIFDMIKQNGTLIVEGLLKDIYNAGRLAGQVTETAKLLQEMGALCSGLNRAYAYELSGRLWHTLNDQKAAFAQFKTSFETIKTLYAASLAHEKDYTRIHWYYVREALQNDKVDTKLVAALLKDTLNKAYYDDIFDSFLVDQFRNKNGEVLQKIYPSIDAALSPQMLAQYDFVMGFFTKDLNKSDEYLNRAYDQNSSLYYHIVAALSLKKEIKIGPFFHTPDAQQLLSTELSGLIDKMIELGYTDLALDTAISNRSQLEAGDFDSISKTIESQNNLPLETRMLEIRKNLFGLPDDNALLKKTYPLAFLHFIEPLKARVPPSLQLALLRTESFFNPAAQSLAGAQGLSQFMPETASEIARILKKENYDILDPETAIVFSAVYLERLKTKHRSWAQSLAAYNAGTGRIKRDLSASGHSNMKTYADQLDITETRDYIRRIVESAVLYEYLYGDKDNLFSFAAGLFNED